MKVYFGVCMLPGFAQTAFSFARCSFPGEIESDVGRTIVLGVPGFGAVEPVISIGFHDRLLRSNCHQAY